MFDVDDNRTLDETEFAGFVTAFIYGLGAAFGLRHKDDIMPSTKSIAQLDIIFSAAVMFQTAPSWLQLSFMQLHLRHVVQRLYNRLGEIAASRLKELCSSSALDRTALVEAIRV